MGDVIGFAPLGGQDHGVLWIPGDTVLYDGVREVAERLEVDTALIHLGGARFPVTALLRYTMTAAGAIELCSLLRPRTVVPIHYEGWAHFRAARRSRNWKPRRRTSVRPSAGSRSARPPSWPLVPALLEVIGAGATVEPVVPDLPPESFEVR